MNEQIQTSQTFVSLKSLGIGNIIFGTNITFPLLFENGPKEFAKTAFRYTKQLIAGDSKEDWGKSATIKATKNLIPCVKKAMDFGLYTFDCSRAYDGSEQRLAKALKSHLRESVFVITKIDDNAQFLGRVEECFEESLRQLKTEYIDLLLLHWPVDYPAVKAANSLVFKNSIPVYVRSWKVLERIYKSGKAKSIGVANFSIAQLEILKKYAEIMPMANEFECHPLCIREELNQYCADHHIQVLAYSALCSMDKRLINDSMIHIAKEHHKSIAQIILKWHLQNERIPIFGTTKPERIKEYTSLDDFILTKEEISIINNQNINYRAYPDSEHCDFTKGIWVGWDKYKDCCP